MIIRREDFGNIDSLTKGSKKKIWFLCESCGIGILQAYRNYLNQKEEKLCRKCRNKRTASLSKKKISESMKKKWKDSEYRDRLTDGRLSDACKNAWTPERRKYLSKNNPMKNIKNIEEQSLSSTTSEDILNLLCEKYGHTYLGRIRQRKGGVVVIFKCSNDHFVERRLDHFRRNITECPYCNRYFSGIEEELFHFLSELNLHIERNNRNIIPPYEIDLYIPEKRLAIEVDGIFWHSDRFVEKNYHLNKTEECEKKGIQLIHIFEDEWKNKKEIVKLRLTHMLGKSEEIFYARKCEIREISVKEAREFCERYHLQGYTGSNIKLGLFYKDVLVSVMTFAKPSIAKGNRIGNDNSWELSRFCSSIPIIGGASKLLSYFKKNYEWDTIYSFADRRWSIGNVYEKIGFKKIGYTKPNYWYWINENGNLKRLHRFNFRKNKITEKDDPRTEKQIMDQKGIMRIWDCGNIKYQIKREKEYEIIDVNKNKKGRRINEKDYINKCKENGFTLSFDKWKGKRTVIKYKCKNNHVFSFTYRKNVKCPVCEENKRKERQKELLKKENYTLLYSDNNIFQFICPNGHKHQMFWSNWYNGQRCGKCFDSISNLEQEIYDFVNDYVHCIQNDRKIINPKEIDIFLPEHNIGIEVNGLFWHSDQFIDKNYHLNKTEECEKKGIQLIHIFEDEWKNKKEIVKSIILSKIGLIPNKIYARKCEIRELTSKEVNKFLEENHLQGKCASSIRYGLFYKDVLVSCMTFGKRNITKNPGFELLRFCNKIDTIVVGGASKIFSHFLKNNNVKNIISYADRRYSTGEFYKNLGFEFSHNSKPSYYYFKEKREHRSKYMKHKLSGLLETFDPALTEYENMKENGYNKIWDCGCVVYKFKQE